MLADQYFVQTKYCMGIMGRSDNQKLTSALRMLEYGVCTDAIDKNLAISECPTL